MNPVSAFFWDWVDLKLCEARHYNLTHLEVHMPDAHFHPVKVEDLDSTKVYHWQICPDCKLVYFIPSGVQHNCILPHMDDLIPAAPVIDPQPRLATASFCKTCGFIISSPEADLIHSENCPEHNIHPLYIGETLCPTEDQSGSA